MAQSETSICNMALVSAGARTQIASLNEESTAARTCKLFYENTRDELLAEAPWGFATKFAALGLLSQLPGAPGNDDTGGSQVWLSSYPAPGWLYQYAYPEDCIALRWVIPQGQWGLFLSQAQTNGPWRSLQTLAIPFAISYSNDAQAINTNAQQAIAAYTARVTNPAVFKQNFSQALAGRLAARLVIPLSGDKVLAQGAFNVANAIVDQVKVQSANESFDMIDNIPDWQKIRDWPDDFGGPPGWWLQGGS